MSEYDTRYFGLQYPPRTTGDGISDCNCNLHRCAPAAGIAPWYQVLAQGTSLVAPGLSILVDGPSTEEPE